MWACLCNMLLQKTKFLPEEYPIFMYLKWPDECTFASVVEFPKASTRARSAAKHLHTFIDRSPPFEIKDLSFKNYIMNLLFYHHFLLIWTEALGIRFGIELRFAWLNIDSTVETCSLLRGHQSALSIEKEALSPLIFRTPSILEI